MLETTWLPNLHAIARHQRMTGAHAAVVGFQASQVLLQNARPKSRHSRSSAGGTASKE